MFKPSGWAVAALAVAGTPLLWAQTLGPALPPGEMQAKARTACLECHDAHIILQQRLDRNAWTREVDKMIKWGALVEAKDREALLQYLSNNFPPDKAPEPAPRVETVKEIKRRRSK